MGVMRRIGIMSNYFWTTWNLFARSAERARKVVIVNVKRIADVIEVIIYIGFAVWVWNKFNG